MKLYELTAGYLQVQHLMDEGEDFQVALDQISDEFDVKVESVAKMVRGLEAEAKAYQEEARRLSERAGAVSSNAANLKQYLLTQMVMVGKPRVDGQILKVAVQASPLSCVVDDQELVPETFLRVIPEQKEVDRKAIIAHFKSTHELIPGTRIEERNHIVIR